MIRHRRRVFVAVALFAVVASGIAWCAYTARRKAHFLRELHIVSFSTSLIGMPHAETERAAHERAQQLNIDLLAAYKDNLDGGARFSLAWMLITKESPGYCQFARDNVASVPWPEVRIWGVRREDEPLSSEYRKKLLGLLIASPTSEAKLAVGGWYRGQGRTKESEDAYHAAMTSGFFWDALDAADELLASERYHDDAVNHLLSVIRDSEPFTQRAAISLLDLYGVREQLLPLVESCNKEPKSGRNRRALAQRLSQLVEKVAGTPDANTNVP